MLTFLAGFVCGAAVVGIGVVVFCACAAAGAGDIAAMTILDPSIEGEE